MFVVMVMMMISDYEWWGCRGSTNDVMLISCSDNSSLGSESTLSLFRTVLRSLVKWICLELFADWVELTCTWVESVCGWVESACREGEGLYQCLRKMAAPLRNTCQRNIVTDLYICRLLLTCCLSSGSCSHRHNHNPSRRGEETRSNVTSEVSTTARDSHTSVYG